MSNVVGSRIAAADIDGDGYPDLIIHANGSNNRETLGAPPKLVWALMNRPNPSGGRMFVDATVGSGLFQVRGGSSTELRSAQLASVGDIDNDGDLDVFSGTYVDPTSPATDTGDRSEVMINDGTGHFTLAPISDPHPVPSALWPTTGATMSDVDRDGKLDLFVGYLSQYAGARYLAFQAQLYSGHGDGTFTTNTGPFGLTTVNDGGGFAQDENAKAARGVTSCDLDGDGAPELMVSADGRQWNSLYRNDGSGTFTEVGQASGFAADSDVDYMHRLSTDMGPNQSFLCYCAGDPTAPDCSGVEPPLTGFCPGRGWIPGISDQPWRNGGNNFSTFCGDVNGDGRLDVYTAGIHYWDVGQSGDSSELLVNTTPGGGSIAFSRPGNAVTGLAFPHPTVDWNEAGMMVAGGDLDDDGRVDLIVAASDYADQFGLVFHQKQDGTFEEVGQAWGMHHPCMSGLSIADFDRDGDLDVVVGSGTARDCAAVWSANEVHFYENKGASGQQWLELRLVGDGSTANKSAFGARITVHAGGTDIVRELDGSYGYMSMQNDTMVHVGLGACSTVDSVTVRWPDKRPTIETFSRLTANQVYELRMGDATPHPIVLP